MNINNLKSEIATILSRSSLSINMRLQSVCDLLKNNVSYYDWVGFYFANKTEKTLHLKAFSGEPTEHTTIPFGKGICGQVAVSNQNFIVQDVTEQDNYISCGWKVKSEIVIPILHNGENVGQIDIDSHTKNTFTQDDEALLEFVCHEVSKIL